MQNIAEILEKAGDGPISRAALQWQCGESGRTQEQVLCHMHKALEVMRQSVTDGLRPVLRSASGRVGGQAALLYQGGKEDVFGLMGLATSYALAVAESNACMGRIVAAPTAGSCGILPGVLLALAEYKGLSDDALVRGLLTAAAIGRAIALGATLAGAEGGCQAECGSAAAMAAAAACELLGGSAAQAADAAAFSLMNLMGLVCDPVGGLVEIPCVYRNVGGVSIALSSAQMALSGVVCPIPCDEVIGAMKDVGDSMPPSLRETGEGGCAACPSMCRKAAKG